MEIKDLLPIGSIVRLNNGEKKLMIFGVKQTRKSESASIENDYIGVLYPEGNMGDDYQYCFDHDQVGEVYFRGFEDDERDNFIEALEKIYTEKQ